MCRAKRGASKFARGLGSAGCSVVLIVSGCSLLYQRQHPEPRSRQATAVVLAAANAHQIRLFGDLPGTPAPGYVSRTFTSLRQHTFTDVGGDFDVDVSATDDRIVFASTRHHVRPDLYIKSVDGVAVTQLTSDPASDLQPAFSPDDTRVAFASDRAGDWDIWVVGVGGGPPVQVTSGPADDLHPSWSPDGAQVVYCSLPPGGGQWELWIADVGRATRKFIGYGLFPEWAASGDRIVFQRARERGSRWFSIWSVNLVDGEPRYPTELASAASHAMILPTPTADGRRIAYVSVPLRSSKSPVYARAAQEASPVSEPADDARDATPYDIWIMDVDGAGKVRLTDGQTMNHGPAFSPEGRVFFTCNRNGHENIWSLSPGDAGGRTTAAAATPHDASVAAGFSRSGPVGRAVPDGL